MELEPCKLWFIMTKKRTTFTRESAETMTTEQEDPAKRLRWFIQTLSPVIPDHVGGADSRRHPSLGGSNLLGLQWH